MSVPFCPYQRMWGNEMVIIVRDTMRPKDKWGCLVGGLVMAGFIIAAVSGFTLWLSFVLFGFISIAASAGNRTRGWFFPFSWIAIILMLVGASGFFGMGILATEDSRLLCESIEWPVGYAEGIITTADGRYIVPQAYIGRVQIYDANWHFIRGWQVHSHGREITLRPAGNERVEVVTSGGKSLGVYSLEGEPIPDTKIEREAKVSVEPPGHALWVPTHWWLISFTHPMYSWLAMGLGMGLFALVETLWQRHMKRQRVEAA